MEHQSYWPTVEAQAVMQQWFKAYPLIAYGMCFRLGVCMQMGMPLPEAARYVEDSRDTIDHTCGWGE
jgi:hypothetical protein